MLLFTKIRRVNFRNFGVTYKCHSFSFQLEPYMDEAFIENAFRDMGETCLTVKLIKNKITR